MKKPLINIFFLCFLLSFVLAGCNQKPTETQPAITETVMKSKTTITAIFTLVPSTSTPTWTPSPTMLTPTMTLSPVPATITPSPIPTLSRAARQTYLIENLSNNNKCKLPCWLGITPGSTSWEDVRGFLNYLGIHETSQRIQEDGSIIHDSSKLSFDTPILHHILRIIERNSLVEGIYLNVEGYNAPKELQEIWKLYSPKNIMQTYGAPSRVWVSTESREFGNRHPYDLLIAYDLHGTVIHYSGWLTRANSNFRICPRFEQGMDIQFMEIYLQSPDDPKDLDESNMLEDPELIRKKSKRIKEASRLDEEQFKDIFIQNEGIVCFDTPVDIWPEFFNR